ncbi:hypothetical protein ACOCEA_14750 [Maribacter sp. CXY002]|uniref:hypothetical protein n=1 Tax=Maribacter luteocoastalis TaxID=3407671 RepID=UPI003B673A72
MMKKYNYIFLFLILIVSGYAFSQEVRIFTLQDFDLKDSVKSCLVSTKYGKEEYDFNKKGLLTKSVTRYNENDYDIVFYKYKNGELSEKRSETYRDNVFDPTTSIAHFYTLDTTSNRKITEKIFTYDKEFMDQYIYSYDDNGDLVKMIHTDNEGTDETLVEYKKYKGEYTITYFINNVPLKSIRTSRKRKKDGSFQKIVLTKEFLKGEENIAFEEVYDEKERLTAQQEFDYDEESKSFVPTIRTTYVYDENGMLTEELAKGPQNTDKKEYIYQYDRGGNGNWVKQIVTPENSYTTRKIIYYTTEKSKLKE